MAETQKNPTCGIVMPISEIDGCAETHWSDVLQILTESIESAGFDCDLVSNADDVGIIQKRIIQNLYDNPIVVCDVSGKNPNVMFELGIRLAFDKPTIIVKDDCTSYTFDTSAIEHLEYPRDLRFNQIIEFKEKLAQKITATHKKAASDPGFTTFLKHFGEFKVAKLDKKEVSGQEYIIEELRNIRRIIGRIDRGGRYSKFSRPTFSSMAAGRDSMLPWDMDICMKGQPHEALAALMTKLPTLDGVEDIEVEEIGDHFHIKFDLGPAANIKEIEKLTRKYTSRHTSAPRKTSRKEN